jgi:hypothetical protein
MDATAGWLRERSVVAKFREPMPKNMQLVWYATGLKKLKDNQFKCEYLKASRLQSTVTTGLNMDYYHPLTTLLVVWSLFVVQSWITKQALAIMSVKYMCNRFKTMFNPRKNKIDSPLSRYIFIGSLSSIP